MQRKQTNFPNTVQQFYPRLLYSESLDLKLFLKQKEIPSKYSYNDHWNKREFCKTIEYLVNYRKISSQDS